MAAPAERAPKVEVDRVRLERFFNDHPAAVWRALRRRGLSPEAAEDATQETFLLAAERLADIRPESERSFLIATADGAGRPREVSHPRVLHPPVVDIALDTGPDLARQAVG